MNIAIFVSGNGSNLEALIDAEKKGRLGDGKIKVVVSDKEDAFALRRAKKAGIPSIVQSGKLFTEREKYDEKLLGKLEERKIELLVLAGFMRILSPVMINAFPGRILNVHPALLPSFKGARAIKEAFEYGVKITGVTVHLVEEEVDSGPILAQRAVRVPEKHGIEKLEEEIHKAEHGLYPETVRKFIEGKFKIEGRKARLVE